MAKTMLEVTAVGAIQLPDVEVMRGFGVKMDSYLTLELGNSTAKTKKAYGGGRNPNWQEVLRLDLQPGVNELCIRVWKYSKISAHEEIARGAVLLPARELQGGQSWDQRVTLQPTRFGKGSALGGEVLLKLHFTSVQEASPSVDMMWPSAALNGSSVSSSLPSQSTSGEQGLLSAGASASLSRLMNKLQKPRKSRVSSDPAPVASPLVDTNGAVSNGETVLGQSPKQSSTSSLQKALDKVFKRMGAKDKERPSTVTEGGYATAEDSDTASRRSSITSLTEPPPTLPELHGAAHMEGSQGRHRNMPGWHQAEEPQALPRHASTSTQTSSPTVHPSSSGHPQQQPSLESSFLPCQSDISLSPHMSSVQSENVAEEGLPAMISARSSGASSMGMRSHPDNSQAAPAAVASHTVSGGARFSGFPTPPSPFLAAQEQCLLEEAAPADFRASQTSVATSGGAASGASSSAEGNRGSAAGSEAVHTGASETGNPAPAAAQNGRVRLEHLDSAIRHRQRNAETPVSAASQMNSHAAASSGPHPALMQDGTSAGDAGPSQPSSAEGPSSQAIPICPPPNRGFIAVQPLGSPFADQSFMDSIDRSLSSGHNTAVNRHRELLSTMSSRHLACMDEAALQAGLKSMPGRIPALPNAISEQGNGCVEDEIVNGGDPTDSNDASVPHIGALALQPRLSAAAEDEEDLKEAAELVQRPREICESLTRNSPFLPEVLQSLNDYNDIVFCEENGRPVLLGEGSFGQVYKAIYLDCDIAVKKLNRINDTKSEQAFRRECAILKGCRHPHIVNFMGVCKDEVGRICLMTELMDTSLMSALLLPDDANKEYHYYGQGRSILKDVAKALIYLHKHNIVHLDVKSANVLLKRGDAKLADVGLSLMLSKSFAQSCSGMGTFSWAATELLLGSHPVTTACDIYSFGVLLWEVCTLEQPHLRNMRDITEKEAPEAIRQLFADCIREDPSSRPTAKQVLQVLMEN